MINGDGYGWKEKACDCPCHKIIFLHPYECCRKCDICMTERILVALFEDHAKECRGKQKSKEFEKALAAHHGEEEWNDS